MVDTTEEAGRVRGGRAIAALWFAVLAGPVAWMLGLNVQYSLVRLECENGGVLPLHLVSLATFAIAAAGGVVAWREWRRAGGVWPGEGPGAIPRSRFMAAMGLLGSPLFALAILAQWVASWFLNPCMGI
ncbi:MAG TPA: hypothetical protein VF584_15405 [Longimicrobium sp.]|jgi:hypothetical protein